MRKRGKLRLHGKNKQVFVEGLKKYQERGVRILIDGKEALDDQFERILEIYPDGSFYMGDYIWEQVFSGVCASSACGEAAGIRMPGQSVKAGSERALMRETSAGYEAAGQTQPGQQYEMRLKEIRFDRVYH